MPLLLAGIDEAGYGPTLGPLCVGFSLFRVHDWEEGDPAPCLWRLCKSGLCRKPSDTRRRVAIADSKALKLPNDVKNRHPLVHLERGLLAMLRCRGHQPATDVELFQTLGAALPDHPWYAGLPVNLPLGQTASQIAIAANRLVMAFEYGGVELLDLRCLIISEAAVNQAIRETGTKASATIAAVGAHLRGLLAAHPGADHLRIVCDQLGGRTQYQEVLARELPTCEITPLAESGERSRYAIAPRRPALSLPATPVHALVGDGEVGATTAAGLAAADTSCRTMRIIQFMPEAETHHLPVALASMIAKFTRELAMMRFNRYFAARLPELKPTAGYYGDAGRWLREIGDCITAEERTAIIRRA